MADKVRPSDAGEGVRLDRWLWAARFFKTRALAAAAITGGRVDHNESRPKPSRVVRPGDRIRVRSGGMEWEVTILETTTRRVGPSGVAELFQEAEASVLRRARVIEQHRLAAAASPRRVGKPTKGERQEIRRLKGRD